MRVVHLLLLLPLALLVVGPARPVLGQAVVQRVDLQVTIEDPQPHPVIRERLVATVQSVADRLLAGRPLEQLAPLEPRLGDPLAAVVDRVATGYTVASVAIQLGAIATVTVHLRPAGTIIREVEVAPDLQAVHPRLHPLVGRLLQDRAVPEIRALYTALPAAAMEWAAPLLEARAREAVEAGLAGFTAAVRARVRGDGARVEVGLRPRDTRVVRNIGVRFRSSSIPTMLLDQHGPAVASMADPLRGLPVVFAQAHQQALTRLISADLAAYPPARQYRIIATPVLDVGETTYVIVVADSLVYRGRVEAQLNIGTRAPGPAVVGHLGRRVTPGTEAFLELRLVPNTLSLEWLLGAEVAVSPTVALGASFAVVAQEPTVWTAVRLGLDTGLRGAWNLRTQAFEGALTYRVNEFLSGELIGTSQGEWWLRLTSNL